MQRGWTHSLTVLRSTDRVFTPFSPSAAPIKRTAVEKQVNTQIVFLFMLLLGLSIGSTIGASIRSVSADIVNALDCMLR